MRTFTDWLRNEGFRPKREDIYEEACTHSSYANEHPHGCDNNERLEFMGDAVLQIWSAVVSYAAKDARRENDNLTSSDGM